jgi:4'-phosphopantetheinyl transferase
VITEIAGDVWLSARNLGCAPTPAVSSAEARTLLADLVSSVMPSIAEIEIVRTSSGAPEIAGAPHVRVSLSHDGPWVAAAVAVDRAVGVDVQVPLAGTGRRLVRRCLGRHAPLVDRLPADRRDEELAWVWTVQESCVKARGTGMNGCPWAVDVPPFRRAGRTGELAWRSLRGVLDVPLSCAYGDPGGRGGSIGT